MLRNLNLYGTEKVKTSQVNILGQIALIKKFGMFGFMFFLLKGMLWLALPFLMAYLGMDVS